MNHNDKTSPNDNDNEKIEINTQNSADGEEEKIKTKLRDPSRIYNGRSNALIFKSEDTNLQPFRELYNEMTDIIAFTLNSEGMFEFLYWNKESNQSIKSAADDLDKIILTDNDDDGKL